MKLFNKAKNVIRAWLDITPAQKNIYYLNETFNFESNAINFAAHLLLRLLYCPWLSLSFLVISCF